ncbi:MAG: glutamate racemase [Ruminococcaceae bacterium]|nr:glutamate racemase [Oscillospiraceae bacterium]
MSDKKSAIGVFDSGLGGLTAIKQLKKILPNEHFIYFGDTGRVPYGTRSFETVLQYADDDMRFLMDFNIKAAVVACGTVSAIALPKLKEKFPLPIIGAINPASCTAAQVSKTKNIAVFATQATINRKAFDEELKKLDGGISVYPVACPMFVPLIEAGYIDKNCAVTRLIAAEYLEQIKDKNIDTLILGCTHYPIIKELIGDVATEVLGREIEIIDSGLEAARATKEILIKLGLQNNCEDEGSVRYFVSDETQNFKTTASIFLGEPAENVTKVSIG